MRIEWSQVDESRLEHIVAEAARKLVAGSPAKVSLGTVAYLVGSSLIREDPGDVDVLIDEGVIKRLALVLSKVLKADREVHVFESPTPPHGPGLPLYELHLVRREEFELTEPSEYVSAGTVLRIDEQRIEGAVPDEGYPVLVERAMAGRRIQIHKWYDLVELLDYHTGERLDGYDKLKLEVWSMDAPDVGVWDAVLDASGRCAIIDVLVWDMNPVYKLPVAERLVFRNKTQLGDLLYLPEFEIVGLPEDAWELVEEWGSCVIRPLFVDGCYVVTAQEAKRGIRPGKPLTPLKVGSGYHKEEWFTAEDVWKFWAKPMIDQGHTVVAEEKYDGFRIMAHKRGKRVWLFTEDAKRDRSKVLPALADAVRQLPFDELIIDMECMAFEDDKPVPRIDLAPLWGGNKPVDLDVRGYVFDILWLNGKDLHERPFAERRKILEMVLKRDKTGRLILAKQVGPIKSLVQLVRAFKELSSKPESEGVMLKTLDSPYELDGATKFWAKLKEWSEADYVIIGIRKVPAPKPAGEHWTAEEAMRALPDLLKKSKTYTFRVAILRDGKLVPVESKHKLTESDLQLRWNESKQAWEGTEDPKYWEMGKGFDDRGPGEYAYAQTYAVSLDEPPKIGQVVAVAASEIDLWKDPEGKWHISWQHPRVRTLKRGKGKPDSWDFVKRFARIRESLGERPVVLEGKGPSREGGEGSKGEDTHKVRYQPGRGRRLPFVIQYHARGLIDPERVAELRKSGIDNETWRNLGFYYLTEPIDKVVEAVRSEMKRAGRLEANWMDDEALMEAAVSSFVAVAKRFLSKEYPGEKPDPERVVQIGNCHIDLRFMDPSGEFLRGWTMITSPLAWQTLSGEIYYPIPDYFLEAEGAHWVCAAKLLQPLPWLTLVKPGKDWWAPPGSPGSTANSWGHFEYVDSGYLYLGVQKDDYHEYMLVLKEHEDRNGLLHIAKIPSRESYERLGQVGEWWWTGFHTVDKPYILRHDRKAKEEQAKREKLTYIMWNPEGVALAYKDPNLRKLFEGVNEDELKAKLEQYRANGGVWP